MAKTGRKCPWDTDPSGPCPSQVAHCTGFKPNVKPFSRTNNSRNFRGLAHSRRHAAARHAAHHLFHAPTRHFAHHFFHLRKLLQQAIYILDLQSPSPPLCVSLREPLMIFGKRRSPGVIELMMATWRFSCCSLALVLQSGRIYIAGNRQFIEHRGHTAHVHHLLELVLEVGQVKTAAFLELLGEFFGLFLADFVFLFPLPATARHPCRVFATPCGQDETPQAHQLFSPTPTKTNRLAGRPLCTDNATPPFASPSALVSTTRRSTGRLLIKCRRGIYRVLSCHTIDDKKSFCTAHVNVHVQRTTSCHHVVVDVQATLPYRRSSTSAWERLRFIEGAVNNFYRLVVSAARAMQCTNFVQPMSAVAE